MNLLMLFDRRDTCPTCPLRDSLISHLQARFQNQKEFLKQEHINANIAEKHYPKSGCACLIPEDGSMVKYDFSTRSDASCGKGKPIRVKLFESPSPKPRPDSDAHAAN